MFYGVYRSVYVFILAVRANGELLDNSQTILIIKSALCVIWVSAIQKVFMTLPVFYTHLTKQEKSSNKTVVNSISIDKTCSESDESQTIHVIHSRMDEFFVLLKKNNVFSLMENWMHSLFSAHNLPITKTDLEEEEKFV